jgi:hypothetical protein
MFFNKSFGGHDFVQPVFSLTPALSRPPTLRFGATPISRVEAAGEDRRWERENCSSRFAKSDAGIGSAAFQLT